MKFYMLQVFYFDDMILRRLYETSIASCCFIMLNVSTGSQKNPFQSEFAILEQESLDDVNSIYYLHTDKGMPLARFA